MGKHMNYSDKDLQFIKDNYRVLSDEQIASILNRTPRGIRNKRNSLHLTAEYSADNINLLYGRYRELEQLKKMKADGVLPGLVDERIKQLSSKEMIVKKKIRTPIHLQAKIYELYVKGKFKYKIAHKFGLNPKTIDRIIDNVMPKVTEPIIIVKQSKI